MPKFKSNRIWFIRNGIKIAIVPEIPEKPILQLHRTETMVGLPSECDPEKSLSMGIWKEWQKRKLIVK